MSQQTTPGQKLDNLAFNRNLVLWSHITQGAIPAFTFLSPDLAHFNYMGRRSSIALMMLTAPVVLPYFIHCSTPARL
jgi:hypothetical protein